MTTEPSGATRTRVTPESSTVVSPSSEASNGFTSVGAVSSQAALTGSRPGVHVRRTIARLRNTTSRLRSPNGIRADVAETISSPTRVSSPPSSMSPLEPGRSAGPVGRSFRYRLSNLVFHRP